MPKSLNEISKGTLHSYRDKARLQSKVNKRNAETMDNVAKQRAKAGDNKGMSQALDSAKRKRMIAYKRDAGSDKALQKLRTKAKDEANYHKDMAAQGPHKAPSDKEMKKMAKYYNAEEVNKKDTKGLKKLSDMLKGSSKAHMDQKKELDKLIQNEGADLRPVGKSSDYAKYAEQDKKKKIKEAKVKNCGCGKDPCETYGSKEQQMQEIAQSSTINHMLTPAKNVKVLKKGTVSELDDKTLKSYEDKAVADADKKRKAGDYAGHSKRYSGIHKSQMKRLSRATDRLKKSASDLRQATNRYLNKEETLNERGLSASEKRNREDIVKGMKKNKTDFMKRYGRDHEAVMYATATKLAKQDEETIKEVSTDTLVNYAKAADASMKKDSSKQNVKKRIKGLANVGKKLADRKFNEETINELDKDTLKSYVGKAQAERLHNIDKFEKQSKRGESIIAKSALKKVQKRGLGIRQAQKKLGEAEFDADKPRRGIQRKRVNLQFGRQQRHNPTPFKKDQQQDLYKKDDPIHKKIRKSRENKRFPDYRQDKDIGVIKKEFDKGGEHSKKYGGVQNKKTKPDALVHKEDRVIKQLRTLMSEKKSLEINENKYELYSSGEHKTAHRFAEKEIDRHLAKAKKMKDYHTARTHMDKVLAKHAKHGSDDSEPHQIVTGHLNNHFGTKHGHNDHLDFMKGRPEYSGPRVKPVKENFKDGRNPEDKGDAKRHGLSGKQSTSSLKKVRSSDSASPRKKQLAHWILNMRKGRNKNK